MTEETKAVDAAGANDSLQIDLIDGVTGDGGYAKFTGWSKRRCYYLLEQGLLPGGKLGGRWIGSRWRVRAFLSKLTNGDTT